MERDPFSLSLSFASATFNAIIPRRFRRLRRRSHTEWKEEDVRVVEGSNFFPELPFHKRKKEEEDKKRGEEKRRPKNDPPPFNIVVSFFPLLLLSPDYFCGWRMREAVGGNNIGGVSLSIKAPFHVVFLRYPGTPSSSLEKGGIEVGSMTLRPLQSPKVSPFSGARFNSRYSRLEVEKGFVASLSPPLAANAASATFRFLVPISLCGGVNTCTYSVCVRGEQDCQLNSLSK